MEGECETEEEYGPQSQDDFSLKEFIELLGKLPVLWNSKHEKYLNKSARFKAYNDLLAIYKKINSKATIDDVRRKINSLRSNFRKIKRKLENSKKTKNPAEKFYTPKSWAFNMCQFLEDATDNERSAIVNIPIKGDKAVCSNNKIVPTLQNKRSKRACSFSSPVQAEKVKAENPPLKQRKLNTVTKPTELNQTCSFTPHPVTLQSSLNPNINPTALYWTEKLQMLNMTQRILAEKTINDILHEAEIGNLSKDSVRIESMYETENSEHLLQPEDLFGI